MKESCAQIFMQSPVKNDSGDFKRDKKVKKLTNEKARISRMRDWKAAEEK